jgi:hypothetical protein
MEDICKILLGRLQVRTRKIGAGRFANGFMEILNPLMSS